MPVSGVSPDDPIVASLNNNLSPILAALPYPSPYFDLAQTYFPRSYKEMFKYCAYFYNTHCIIPAVINKLASYPITDLIYATQDEMLRDRWQTLMHDILNISFQMYQMCIDELVFGNSFTGVYLPFKRSLECNACEGLSDFKQVKEKKIRGRKLAIHGTCPKCKNTSTFKIKDKYLKDPYRINIIRYDPYLITIIKDPVSGTNKYLWQPPSAYCEAIRKGTDMDLFEKAPQIILDAIAEDKLVVMNPDNFYHMKRPSTSMGDSAWGPSILLPALKSLYYLQVLKMAQEAVAVQHIIPLWILFPQGSPGSASAPTASSINLGRWKAQLEDELKKWRKDRNHIPILNFPVGFEQLGGEGRALLLAPEVKQETENVIVSMGVPLEFVWGGMTWTGSSITLRMLENTFTGIRDSLQRFLRFLTKFCSKFLNYGAIEIRMSELKMADDVQRQQIALNMEAAGKISTSTLLDELNYDFKEEEKRKKEEFPTKMTGFVRDTLLQARAQGEASIESTKYQLKTQDMQVIGQVKAQALQQQAMAELGLTPPPMEGDPNAQQGAPQQDPNAQQAQDQIDPSTGLPIDPNLGLPYDPNSGMYVDPATGQQMTPEEAQMFVQQQSESGQAYPPGYEQQAQQGMPQEVQQDPSMMGDSQGQGGYNTPVAPGGAESIPGAGMAFTGQPMAQPVTAPMATGDTGAGVATVEDQRSQQLEAEARQGLMGQMPPELKAVISRWANELLMAPAADQQQILAEMQAEMPTVTMLVKQRMMELQTIQPAVPQPQQPQVQAPAPMNPLTLK